MTTPPLSQTKKDLFRALIKNREAESKEVPSNLIPFKKGAPGVPPLFFFPATDGGVSYFRHMAAHLPEHLPFYGVQAPGFDEEREPFRTVESSVEYSLRNIRALQPHGPYYTGGFCMGGLPSYELATRLQEEGEEVVLVQLMPVFLRPWKVLPGVDALQLRAIEDHTFIFERMLGIQVPLPMEQIRSMPESEERYDFVTRLVREGGYLKGPAEEHLFRHRMKMYEAGLNAMLGYEPKRQFKGPVDVIVVGLEHRKEMELDLDTPYTVHLRALPPEQVRYHKLDADSSGILSGEEPDCGRIAQRLARLLEKRS